MDIFMGIVVGIIIGVIGKIIYDGAIKPKLEKKGP